MTRSAVLWIEVWNAIQLPPDASDWSSEELNMGKGRIALASLQTKIQTGCWCGTTRQQNQPESSEQEEEQQQVRLDDRQDMIDAVRGRGFVVSTAEFATRLNCGSDRGPTLSLLVLLSSVRDSTVVVIEVQHCC